MSDYIEIHWTSGSIDEARKLSRYLVQERLAASAQIIPWIESVTMWNNQLETSQESKVIIKTHRDKYEEIKGIIEKNSKYQIPEITFVALDGGNPSYFTWLQESVHRT